MSVNLRHLFAVALAVLWLGGNFAEAKTFTGHFQGEGRGCWGDIWIRTKTIQWNSDWSACYSPYTIVKKTFADKPQNFDSILYKIERPRRSCSWKYIGMYFYLSDAPGLYSNWLAVGFPKFRDYQNFDEHIWLTGQWSGPGQPPVLFCDLTDFSD